MNADERHWIEEALQLAEKAKEKGVAILLIRRQDTNSEADVAITNATSADAISALALSVNGPGGQEDGE